MLNNVSERQKHKAFLEAYYSQALINLSQNLYNNQGVLVHIKKPFSPKQKYLKISLKSSPEIAQLSKYFPSEKIRKKNIFLSQY